MTLPNVEFKVMFGALTPTVATSVSVSEELIVTEFAPVTLSPSVTVVPATVDADKVTS